MQGDEQIGDGKATSCKLGKSCLSLCEINFKHMIYNNWKRMSRLFMPQERTHKQPWLQLALRLGHTQRLLDTKVPYFETLNNQKFSFG